jgi:hypothetical protein
MRVDEIVDKMKRKEKTKGKGKGGSTKYTFLVIATKIIQFRDAIQP